MKKLFAILAILACGAVASYAQGIGFGGTMSASGTVNVNVARNANIAFNAGTSTLATGAGTWVVIGQTKNTGFFVFDITGEATATLDIQTQVNVGSGSGSVTLSNPTAETATLMSGSWSPIANPGIGSYNLASNHQLSGTLGQVPDGTRFVRVKVDFTGVTTGAKAVVASCQISNYSI
ncbi:MAG: hypothetical protein JNL32_14985 [Candidatus Kapabacteria bacterium]|nr:hypothetical protein [Candidatus Kapabacteria bacterium]